VSEKMPLTTGKSLSLSFDVSFTQREMSILSLVAVGLTNAQIGKTLNISKYTVAQHIAKMLRRIGAVNRTDMVNRAHAEGILEHRDAE